MINITIVANKITTDSVSNENSYEIRNTFILEEKKKKVRYKNGYTLPASAQALLNDANRKARHSRILHRNMQESHTNENRPKNVDAHHIVAQEDRRAVFARNILFNWGIH